MKRKLSLASQSTLERSLVRSEKPHGNRADHRLFVSEKVFGPLMHQERPRNV